MSSSAKVGVAFGCRRECGDDACCRWPLTADGLSTDEIRSHAREAFFFDFSSSRLSSTDAPVNRSPPDKMASKLSAVSTLVSNISRKGKRKAEDEGTTANMATVAAPVKRNRQRVLLLPSRGVTAQMRHLIADLEALLPHSKKGE